MDTKLILFEGIPGSGKTTFARETAEWYKRRNIPVNLFIEGQSHPADLSWCAVIPVAVYEDLLVKYASLQNKIERQTVFEGETAIVAHTQVRTDNRDFYKELGSFEVYDGRVPDAVFFELHYNRWSSFAIKAAEKNELNIFECAFLQNHVNELLLWRDAVESDIISHHNKLMDSVKNLSPFVIYLSQSDIKETIRRIARERVSAEHGNWIDQCIEYCENSPFGKKRGITGFDGVIEFFTIRKELEMKILAQLSVPHVIIENNDCDWDNVRTQIEDCLLRQENF